MHVVLVYMYTVEPFYCGHKGSSEIFLIIVNIVLGPEMLTYMATPNMEVLIREVPLYMSYMYLTTCTCTFTTCTPDNDSGSCFNRLIRMLLVFDQ